MAEQIKIQFSGLPGVYPDGYTDTIYLNNTRCVKTQQHKEDFPTSEKYQTTQDSVYRNLMIQQLTYDQYKIELVRKESQSFELLSVANDIIIYDNEQGIRYYAQIIDITNEEIFNSDFQKITIEFYDTNPDNYIGVQPVIDHYKSDVVLRLYNVIGCNVITFYNGPSSTRVYTIINGVKITKDPENLKSDELNGKYIDTRITIKDAIKTIYYISEAEVQEIKNLLLLSNKENVTAIIGNNSSAYTALERPDFTLEQVSNAVDLWKLEVTAVYNINDITPYN